jgi:hypothetical protein
MISFDNNIGSKEFVDLPPLATLVDSHSRPLTEVFNFSDGDIPGDAFFTGNGPGSLTWQIGIEIKSIYDLCGSLDTGRLQGQGTNSSHGQLLRMLDYFDITILIYYGNYWPSDDGNLFIKYFTTSGDELIKRIESRIYHLIEKYPDNVSWFKSRMLSWLAQLPKTLTLGPRRSYWHGLHNALAELQLLGIDVHRVNNKAEVAILISSLYHLFQKPWSKHKLLRTFNTSNPTSNRLASLARLDSTPPHIIKAARGISAICDAIGYERGLAIAYHFDGNIPLMINSIANNPSAIERVRVGKRRIGVVISNAAHRDIKSGKELDSTTLTRMLKLDQ